MSDNRSTKAELIEELERVRTLSREAETRAYAAEKKVPNVSPVPEIEAMAGCVRAFEKLLADEKAGRNAWGTTPSAGSIRRVMKYLADRYGIGPADGIGF